MTDEELSGVQTKDADLLAVLLQVKKNIMQNTHVASIGVVKTSNADMTASVKLYPLLTDEEPKNVTCVCLSEITPKPDDIVVVLFCDRNFLAALKKLKSSQKPATLKENIDLHSDRYGIIIGKL